MRFMFTDIAEIMAILIKNQYSLTDTRYFACILNDFQLAYFEYVFRRFRDDDDDSCNFVKGREFSAEKDE